MEKNNSIIRPFIKSWNLDLKLNKSYLGLYTTSNSFLFASLYWAQLHMNVVIYWDMSS